jgi:hypothetical protein
MSSPPTLLNETLSEARKTFLHELFTTALEGGIGYWSQCSEYHWALPDIATGPAEDIDGFYAIIHPVEGGWGVFGDPDGTVGDCDEDKQPLRIDLPVIHRGARLMSLYVQGLVDGKGQPVPLDQIKPWREDHYHWQYVTAYNTNGKDGDYDADTADMIVQWGLFGEVVYG